MVIVARLASFLLLAFPRKKTDVGLPVEATAAVRAPFSGDFRGRVKAAGNERGYPVVGEAHGAEGIALGCRHRQEV